MNSGPDLNQVGAALSGGSSYQLPGTVPPHSFRWVHLTWVSSVCLDSNGEAVIDSVPLRVRVGTITRTENVRLAQAFALHGPGHGCHGA